MDFSKTLSYLSKFISGGYFAYAIIAGVLFWVYNLYNQNQELKIEMLVKDQNYTALHDTIRIEKQKNGDLQASKTVLLLSEKDLKKQNKELSDEVKQQKGKVISLTKSVVSLKQDTLILRKYIRELESRDSVYSINDSTFVSDWNLKYVYSEKNYDVFKGKTTMFGSYNNKIFSVNKAETELLERESNIDLVWGTKVEDGKIRIFIQSDYPGFSVESLEGVMIDPNDNKLIKDLIKKKKWFTGFNLNMGVGTGYNPVNKSWGMFIGPSVGWSIYQW